MERLLHSRQVAEWLNLAESTIRKWVHFGFIPHFKIPGAVRFRKEVLEEWLQAKSKRGRRSLALEVQY